MLLCDLHFPNHYSNEETENAYKTPTTVFDGKSFNKTTFHRTSLQRKLIQV